MAEKEGGIAPFIRILEDLLIWLESTKTQGVIIGGIAVSLLSRPRMTQDVDILAMLAESQWGTFLEKGSRFGFVPRITDALSFAQKNRVLLLRHTPSGVKVDISFGVLPFEQESIERLEKIKVGTLVIPIPTPEDLIIMKAVAHRGKDLADIEAILEAQEKIDLRRVRKWVKEFAKVLEMPEIYHDLEIIVKKGSKVK